MEPVFPEEAEPQPAVRRAAAQIRLKIRFFTGNPPFTSTAITSETGQACFASLRWNKDFKLYL